MAPITTSPLLVYEIPDAGGQGHRLLVPTGCHVTADETAALVGTIRGPVHLAGDRIGVVRPSRQRSRGGTIRDSSMVALIAGIDVRSASSRMVVSALATLEESLDAVVAEAASAVSIHDSPVLASPEAARVLDSIVALGFRAAPMAPGAPATSVTPEPPPRRPPPVADILLLVGTLAVLAAGFALGWATRELNPGRHSEQAVADRGQHDSTSSQRDTHDGKASIATTSDAPDVGAEAAEKPPTDSPSAAFSPVKAETGTSVVSAPSLEKSHSGPPLQPAPQSDTGDADTAITFRVVCEGTAPDERIQLLRCDNNRPIGRGGVARKTTLRFDDTATDGINSPEQVKVRLWEAPKPARLDPPFHDSEQLALPPDSETYSCVIEFKPAGSIKQRRIEVTVTTRNSAD